MRNRVLFQLSIVAFACLTLAGCRKPPEQRFPLKGKVVSVDKSRRQVTLAHEPIKGYMDAMTMPFNVGDDWALSVLEPGQTVEATLVVREDRSWIEGLRISKSKEAVNPQGAAPLPPIGKAVPDFRLLNQDGQPIHLSGFRGRPLLLTFIYTRCPLPDYCPRTSRNFWEVYREIQSAKDPVRQLRLLTVSFDTDYDTPAILRDYARRYMNPPRFDIWSFATGSPEEIRVITAYFGLVYRRESGQITHSLVTALIGSDGRLARLYIGNDWTPDQVLADLP